MSYPSDPNNQLSPEAAEILKLIVEDTNELRRVDLGEVPPAIAFEVEE